jgi:hypothetical protein
VVGNDEVEQEEGQHGVLSVDVSVKSVPATEATAADH